MHYNITINSILGLFVKILFLLDDFLVENPVGVEWDDLSNELRYIIEKSTAYALAQIPMVWIGKNAGGDDDSILLEIDSYQAPFLKHNLPQCLQDILTRNAALPPSHLLRFFPHEPVTHSELKPRIRSGCCVM